MLLRDALKQLAGGHKVDLVLGPVVPGVDEVLGIVHDLHRAGGAVSGLVLGDGAAVGIGCGLGSAAVLGGSGLPLSAVLLGLGLDLGAVLLGLSLNLGAVGLGGGRRIGISAAGGGSAGAAATAAAGGRASAGRGSACVPRRAAGWVRLLRNEMYF